MTVYLRRPRAGGMFESVRKFLGFGDSTSEAAPTSGDRATRPSDRDRDRRTSDHSLYAHSRGSAQRLMSARDAVVGSTSINQLRRDKFRADKRLTELEVVRPSLLPFRTSGTDAKM